MKMQDMSFKVEFDDFLYSSFIFNDMSSNNYNDM